MRFVSPKLARAGAPKMYFHPVTRSSASSHCTLRMAGSPVMGHFGLAIEDVVSEVRVREAALYHELRKPALPCRRGHLVEAALLGFRTELSDRNRRDQQHDRKAGEHGRQSEPLLDPQDGWNDER